MADKALAREELFSLRETIARMEGKSIHQLSVSGPAPAGIPVHACNADVVPLDIPALDMAFEGGLPRMGMAEIRGAEMRNAGATTGLALSFCAFLISREREEEAPRAVLWIGEPASRRETGEPFAEGLADLGLCLDRLFYAAPRRLEEALWLAEAALASRAFRTVILELSGNPHRFGLSESRRLSLRARHAGSLLLLLRQGGAEEAGSTIFRVEAAPAPSGTHRLPDGSLLRGTIGAPAFSTHVEKSPRPAASLFSQAIALEWNAHECLFALPDASVPSSPRRSVPAPPGARLSASADGPDHPAPLGAVLAFSRAS